MINDQGECSVGRPLLSPSQKQTRYAPVLHFLSHLFLPDKKKKQPSLAFLFFLEFLFSRRLEGDDRKRTGDVH